MARCHAYFSEVGLFYPHRKIMDNFSDLLEKFSEVYTCTCACMANYCVMHVSIIGGTDVALWQPQGVW